MRRHQWMIALLGLLIVCIVGIVLFCNHSVAVQLQCAAYYREASDSDREQRCLLRAYELNPEDTDVLFLLAESYYEKNNKIEYEFYLRKIITNPAATNEQLESAYIKLIGIYKDRKDYETINEILSGEDAGRMQTLFQKFTASPPQFSINPGTYDSAQYLKMTSVGNGNVYYTLNGTTPSEKSMVYSAPILLDSGDYYIEAVFVNEYGVESEVSSGEFHIVSQVVEAPRLNTDSGEYTYPVEISVLNENDDNIYYTTNGTNPTIESNVYNGAIPMPLGETEFRFARIVDGVRSEIVVLQVALKLDTEYTPEMAVQELIEELIASGKLLNEEGANLTSSARYQYSYTSVRQLGDVSNFYLIAEELLDEEGQRTRTGTMYAVDVYTGEKFKLVGENLDQFELISIETN